MEMINEKISEPQTFNRAVFSTKFYIVVNIGCIECGVSSNIVGYYDDKEKAEKIAERCNALLGWREGGQNEFEVFELGKLNVTLDEYKEILAEDNKSSI